MPLDRIGNSPRDLGLTSPLMALIGATLVPPRGLRARSDTKTDLTRKSVGTCATHFHLHP